MISETRESQSLPTECRISQKDARIFLENLRIHSRTVAFDFIQPSKESVSNLRIQTRINFLSILTSPSMPPNCARTIGRNQMRFFAIRAKLFLIAESGGKTSSTTPTSSSSFSPSFRRRRNQNHFHRRETLAPLTRPQFAHLLFDQIRSDEVFRQRNH